MFKEIDYQQDYLIGFNSRGEKKIINYDDIYLVESFTHDIIVHTSFGGLKIKERLYEVEGIFENRDIIRINKSQIIPKGKIMKIIPQYNSKLKILLANKNTVYVSRMYLMSFREKIGM
ncbi:LytTR family DNA-binding domain-containing protein [Peloplasma aerotolerans]|uniref:LytTR family DNA-binding domain-containing protein n=1 Tax=Peloplasma aerotolerans TaxID=3044389 RepID=UPI003D3484F0